MHVSFFLQRVCNDQLTKDVSARKMCSQFTFYATHTMYCTVAYTAT